MNTFNIYNNIIDIAASFDRTIYGNIDIFIERAIIKSERRIPKRVPLTLLHKYNPDNEYQDFGFSNGSAVDIKRTFNNFLTHYKDCVSYNSFILHKDWVLYDNLLYFFDWDPVFPKLVHNIERDKYIAIATYNRGFESIPVPLRVPSKVYYNDDFPIDKVKTILSKDESALLLFFGIPGGGKSTVIKYLASTCEQDFVYMDAKLLNNASSSDFLNYLRDYQGGVVVLEDCEELVKDREVNYNSTINTLLNLTDGILGDAFAIKFICTFNTDVNNIDKALLRKGRLKLKYEFKELAEDKVKEIFKDNNIDTNLAKPMTVSDAFNFTEETGHIEKKNKVGFLA